MPTYIRYISKHLLWPALLITGALTSIIWLTQALRLIDFIVNRGLAMRDFIYITSLLFPGLLSMLVPIASFLAVLFTYNKLQSDSELIVFRGAGLSRLQLATPALLVSLLAAAFCYFLTLYLQPLSMRQFRDMHAFLRDNYSSVLLQEEVFNTPVEGLTVFVRERDSAANLRGILVHDNREEASPVTMMAEQGKLIQGPSGPQFYLEKGLRQERHNGRVSWLNFDQYTIDISFYAEVLSERDRKIDEQYLSELFDPNISDPKARAQARAEGHQRLVWPLYNIALALLAAATMLSGAYSRKGQWKRITVASAMAAMVIVLGIGLRNLAANQPLLTPALYGFVGLMILLALTRLLDLRIMPRKMLPNLPPAGGR